MQRDVQLQYRSNVRKQDMSVAPHCSDINYPITCTVCSYVVHTLIVASWKRKRLVDPASGCRNGSIAVCYSTDAALILLTHHFTSSDSNKVLE